MNNRWTIDPDEDARVIIAVPAPDGMQWYLDHASSGDRERLFYVDDAKGLGTPGEAYADGTWGLSVGDYQMAGGCETTLIKAMKRLLLVLAAMQVEV